ncbi:MAG TPA: SPOR domain-containing protein [Candidatus Acidoferrales bacterium]|nr:SPOR domain-containing protein [Candidatus Acidoferrales bacterium]
MGSNGRRSGGDRILESRHLVGLFFGVVVLCGVFFTLGYVMGRAQYGGAVHAAGAMDPPATAAAPLKSAKAAGATAAVPSEWDFYGKKADDRLDAPVAAAASPVAAPRQPAAAPARSKPAPTAKISGRYAPPRIPRGSIVLQVAALRHESDALALADALRQKRFPSFVIAPAGDNLYRVQTGPYRELHAAQNAQRALEHAGFRAILKR